MILLYAYYQALNFTSTGTLNLSHTLNATQFRIIATLEIINTL